MKPKYLQHDNLDDRREFVILLAKLSPSKRLQFLAWACKQSTIPNSAVRPGVDRKTRERANLARQDSSADEKLTLEVFFDVWNLSIQYCLDLDLALSRLVQIVRKV